MQLKNVVLQAPFGPITLWMARSWTYRSKSLTATSPPKRLTSFRDVRIAMCVSPRPGA
jgi:hypothetical protein